MSFAISIPRRASCCTQGQEPLLPGMEYHSLLKEGEEEGTYMRHDYCSACWDMLQKQNGPQPIRSSWKSVIPLKKEPSELPKQRDARAWILLKEALLRGDRQSNAEAFVLALYLARRRRLFFRQEMKLEGGKIGSLYEAAETEEMICVPKLILSELQIETLQLELAKKFQS